MQKYSLYICDTNKIYIQKSNDIEHRWYIEDFHNKFRLYRITQIDDVYDFTGEYDSLLLALEEAEKL